MFTEAHISCAVLCCSKSLLACDPRNLELKFMFDFGACRQGECIKLAQEIWKEWCGVPRDFSETVRLDTGKKRAMKEDSENFFLAKRRRRVSEDVPLLTCEEVRTATSVHVPVDCERTEKELTIQLRKQFKNTIQNYLWGHLTAAEVPANLIDVAAEFAESRSKQDMQRVKDASKKQALLDAVPSRKPVDLSGACRVEPTTGVCGMQNHRRSPPASILCGVRPEQPAYFCFVGSDHTRRMRARPRLHAQYYRSASSSEEQRSCILV